MQVIDFLYTLKAPKKFTIIVLFWNGNFDLENLNLNLKKLKKNLILILNISDWQFFKRVTSILIVMTLKIYKSTKNLKSMVWIRKKNFNISILGFIH